MIYKTIMYPKPDGLLWLNEAETPKNLLPRCKLDKSHSPYLGYGIDRHSGARTDSYIYFTSEEKNQYEKIISQINEWNIDDNQQIRYKELYLFFKSDTYKISIHDCIVYDVFHSHPIGGETKSPQFVSLGPERTDRHLTSAKRLGKITKLEYGYVRDVVSLEDIEKLTNKNFRIMFEARDTATVLNDVKQFIKLYCDIRKNRLISATNSMLESLDKIMGES